jgi:MinD-like ATPase involved in chromosome partitioning or flagellar assembly
VLTGLPRSSRWSEIEPAKSIAVLDHLNSQFDVIVVDVGSSIEENEWIDNAPQRDGAARAILRRADVALAVGTPDTLGIARLIRGLDDFRSIRDDPLVVLNQTTRSMAAEARSAVERFTSHSVSASVQRDGRRGIEDSVARANSFAPVWSAVKTAKVAASVA